MYVVKVSTVTCILGTYFSFTRIMHLWVCIYPVPAENIISYSERPLAIIRDKP